MSLHVKLVHDKYKIRDLKCTHCEYEASRKMHVTLHINSVHKKIKGHKCNQCEYTASKKYTLCVHAKSAHETSRDNNSKSDIPMI
jgi:hypothetical protein